MTTLIRRLGESISARLRESKARLPTIMVATKDMDNPSVHNHELKLERAAEHLSTLEVRIDDWLDGAYRYVAELDPQSGKKHIRVKVLKPPPAAFSVPLSTI